MKQSIENCLKKLWNMYLISWRFKSVVPKYKPRNNPHVFNFFMFKCSISEFEVTQQIII
jgi:hypothetical protein